MFVPLKGFTAQLMVEIGRERNSSLLGCFQKKSAKAKSFFFFSQFSSVIKIKSKKHFGSLCLIRRSLIG